MKNIFEEINKKLDSNFTPTDIINLKLIEEYDISKNFTDTDIKIEKLIFKGLKQKTLKEFLYTITRKKKVSEDFIIFHKEDINWNIICKYQKLSIRFLEKFKNNVNWKTIFQSTWVTEDIMRKFDTHLDFSRLSDNLFPLSNEFMKDYILKLNWAQVLNKQNCDEEILDMILNPTNPLISWGWVLQTQRLSENFIKKNKKNITRGYNWYEVCKYQDIKENFIEELDKDGLVYWKELGGYKQTLSEKFIDKYRDELDWDKISKYQEMSEEFMNNHIGYLNIELLNKNKRICSQSLEKFKKHWELN